MPGPARLAHAYIYRLLRKRTICFLWPDKAHLHRAGVHFAQNRARADPLQGTFTTRVAQYGYRTGGNPRALPPRSGRFQLVVFLRLGCRF
jgi:hypothetical protein